jgi:hypothetical protein
MVLAGEAIVPLAGAVLDRAVAEDGIVDARLVALQVCEAGEGLAAVVAAKGLCGSNGEGSRLVKGRDEGSKLNRIALIGNATYLD